MNKGAGIILFVFLLVTLSFYFISTWAQTIPTCDSCGSCSDYLQNGSLQSGDTLRLTADIIGDPGHCIDFGGADNLTFDCNGYTISGDGTGSGIYLSSLNGGSDNNTITNCPNISHFYYGINIDTSDNNTISSLTATQNVQSGISTYSSLGTTLTDINSSYNTQNGIYLSNSDDSTLIGITASGNNDSGLQLYSSDNNSITGVSLVDNMISGIYVLLSANNTLSDITIITQDNSGGFFATGGPGLYNNVDNTVTVDGKPVQYFDGYYKSCPDDQTLDYGSAYSQIAFSGCINITLNADDVTDSVYLFYTNNSRINNINSSLNRHGFYLTMSNYNTLTDITANKNKEMGLNFIQSNNNTLSGITADSNMIGINYYFSTGNKLTGLNASGNKEGVRLFFESTYNTINDSSISNSTNYGINLFYYEFFTEKFNLYNTFYNNFFNNTVNFHAFNTSDENNWNTALNCSGGPNIIGGSCMGGNYWTDPDGSNFSDECPDSQPPFGICDSQHNLDYADTDMLPLTFFSGPSLPTIDNHEILPVYGPVGQPVLIGVNASDDTGIESVWADITDPSGNQHLVQLTNNEYTSWNTTVPGTHQVTITANDYAENSVTVTDTFYANYPVEFDLQILDADDVGVSTDLDIYISDSGVSVLSDSDSDGEYHVSLIEDHHDIRVQAFSDRFGLLLREVNISAGFSGSLRLDESGPADGFENIFAVDSDYPMDESAVTIYYDNMDYSDSDSMYPHVCEDWNFEDRECESDWERLDDFTNNDDDEYIEFSVDSFSAFAILEESSCGDGTCDDGENAQSCPSDCLCDEGDTRSCNRPPNTGRCATGTETCVNNEWVGCLQPIAETCNFADDDCDGTIDDTGDGTSVQETKCQCYDGGLPQPESCNGIDDDCDGSIDFGGDCCEDGETRSCGPGTDEGGCSIGVISCIRGTWSSSCVGAAYPANEICDDLLDNDCDGETDENCEYPTCPEGTASGICLCEGQARDTGYCCSGIYSDSECFASPWLILVAIGTAILIVLVILILYFRSQGKELTWEELMKKYSRLIKGN